MAATATSGMVHSAVNVQVAFRNASGYPMGTDSTPDDVTAGATTHMYLAGGLVSFTAPTPTVEYAIEQSGQVIGGESAMGITGFGTPQLTLSRYNETLNSYIKGSATDVSSNTEWAMNAANTNQYNFPRFVTIVSAKFLDMDTLTDYYLNWVFHNSQWLPSAGPNTSQTGGVNPNPLTYDLRIAKSSRNGATGRALSATSGMEVVDGTDTWSLIRTPGGALTVTTYIDDNSTGTFTLGYRPLYDDKTGAAYNAITESGSTTAVTSVATDTGLVTQVAAADENDVWVVGYPTSFVAI